jgi:hypothetical protein
MLHCSCHCCCCCTVPATQLLTNFTQLHSTSQRFAFHQRFWSAAIVETLQRIRASCLTLLLLHAEFHCT